MEKTKENYIAPLTRESLYAQRTQGKSKNPNDFPLLEHCLNDIHSHPFVKSFNSLLIDFSQLDTYMMNLKAEKIFSQEEIEKTHNWNSRTVYRLRKGYFLQAECYTDSEYHGAMDGASISNGTKVNIVSSVAMYTPPENSSLYDGPYIDSIIEDLKEIAVKRNEETPYIGMICKQHSFYIKNFYITNDYTINNPDLHYGQGFQEFHDNLVKRIQAEPKGLVLLHGAPGTGKTYYIRNFLKSMLNIGKEVIYFSPGMVNHLVSPDLMTFLSDTVMEMSSKGKSCVLLLEDAEPLLQTRQGGTRSDGITNLLNLSDGLLNDMLNVQVIATFNTDLKNIDEALLRPERLIARKEFKKLSTNEANTLAKELGLEKTYENPASLADIYSTFKSKETLVHGYESTKNSRIGFNTDN